MRERLRADMASWTVLGYLAGDNDLEGPALDDINEMERVGSRPGSVEVLVQVDRAADWDTGDGDWHSTRRYHITRGGSRRRITSTLLGDLGETNTGDPKVAEDFLRFGVTAFPARSVALVLWNHGSGVYVPDGMLGRGREPAGDAGGPADRASHRARRRRPLFSTACEALAVLPPAARGIAYDDGSGDCLDSRELKRVLRTARRLLRRKVDLLGMDACLMTMIEVAYQVRDQAQILVGSEELEPADGWPYDTILADLVARPTMSPADLAATIVSRYIEAHRRTGADVTQSAIALGRLDDLVGAIDALARALLASLRDPAAGLALRAAWTASLHFFDHLYVDLHDFAGHLGQAMGPGKVRGLCEDIRRIIEGREAKSPVIAEAHAGPRTPAARGLSIYFPPAPHPSRFYRDLDFARRTRWAELLEAHLGRG
jgi:hypothetical protein